MRWIKRIAVVIGVLVLLAIVAGVGILLWKPWVPPATMTDPGRDGHRIGSGDTVGNFYPGKGAGPRPAILLLGGSEGALGSGATRMAHAFQAAGFTVLHLSYFRAPGQSPELALIPLERFDRALDWLRARPEVDRTRMAVVGGSKGAEAALLIGTRHPELKAVVAGMPSSVVWPGIDWNSLSGEARSSWSLGGRPVPALPYGSGSFMSGDLSAIYTDGLRALSRHPAARIPVERGTYPVLLICGMADALWPSCPMARQLQSSAPARVRILAYPNAGHGVFGPPVEGDATGIAKMGGTPTGNQAARRDGWPRVLAFLHAALD